MVFAVAETGGGLNTRNYDGFQAKRVIHEWIKFYNSDRPHSALDKGTPDTACLTQAEIRKTAQTPT